MNLLELRAHHRQQFHPTQDWFVHDDFMRTPAPIARPVMRNVHYCDYEPTSTNMVEPLPLAVTMALLFLQNPSHIMWGGYYWCRDVDNIGQRVYVGQNGRGFEIHRHLRLTSRWGIAQVEAG